ncbi:NAD(P)/FAD-dependent oxidoreductase [Pradoshia sp.]
MYPTEWDCIIIGGGIAGLQAAIQMGRSQHKCLVIDSKEDGRSSLCKDYRNILGWPDGISGEDLRALGKEHAENTGIQFLKDQVTKLKKVDSLLHVQTAEHKFKTRTLLLATGITDRIPPIPNIKECLGMTIYICTDCDGYEVIDKPTLVLGSGKAGANFALSLLYWTNQITYINHEKEEIEQELREKLKESGIQYIEEAIESVKKAGDSDLQGVYLADGRFIAGERGFVAFGGNDVHTALAKQLGIDVLNNRHIHVDPRTKETNVENVWAAGDIVAHSEQATIAMGEATQAAIWIHKRLMKLLKE